MKKILVLVLALSATALLACPMKDGMKGGMMKDGMMGGAMCQGMMSKCEANTSKLPPHLEALGLSDDQKGQIQKIREEAKAFHNQQHDKMMAVLTVEQRAKMKEMPMMCGKMSPKKDGKATKESAAPKEHDHSGK